MLAGVRCAAFRALGYRWGYEKASNRAMATTPTIPLSIHLCTGSLAPAPPPQLSIAARELSIADWFRLVARRG